MNKFLTNKSDIIAWLDNYKTKNYELIADEKYGYVVDIDSNVDLSYRDLKHIPVKFGNISGSFYCSNNNLTSLQFCPDTVNGSFNCSRNKLSSLDFSPTTIGGDFYCFGNKLTSLKFSPHVIKGNFSCSFNSLNSLQFCPHTISGNFYCDHNNLTSLEFAPKIISGGFSCRNNKIANLIHCPNHIGGDIFLENNNNLTEASININKYYNFEEMHRMHLEHKIVAEKEILGNSIGKIIDSSSKKASCLKPNKFKI